MYPIPAATGLGDGSLEEANLSCLIREKLRNKILKTLGLPMMDYVSLPRSERKTDSVLDTREA